MLGLMPTRWPRALPWVAPVSAGSAVAQSRGLVLEVFSGTCLEGGQQVFSTAVEISSDGIIETFRGPSPTPLCSEKQLLGA